MKRMILLTVILVLCSTATSTLAQGDELTQTYTSEDGRWTFRYPEGWVVNIDDDGEISVSNVEDFPYNLATQIPSGQVSVKFIVGTPTAISESGIAAPVDASAEFLAGYWTGYYSLAVYFVAATNNTAPPPVTIRAAESVEINEETTALVQIDIEDIQSALIIAMPATKTSLRTVIVTSAYGEMEDYRDIGVAMMESVEFTP